MSNLVPPSTFRSKYISLSAAALLAGFAIALAVLPSRSAEAVNPLMADVLAAWSFESVTTTGTGTTPVITGSAAADSGVLTAGSSFSGFHTSSATTWSNPVGNGSVRSFSSNNWTVGDYYQFSFSTSGYTAINITWDQTGSNTGPRDFKVQYSTNGTIFTDASGTNSTYAVTLQTWSSSGSPQAASRRTLDLSSVSALTNQSTVYIRLVDTSTTSVNAGTVAAAGTGRVDNFTVNGTAEASTPTPTPTPVLSINDVSVTEGDIGPVTATFTVSLNSPAPVGGVTFDIATADGTGPSAATVADNDYVAKSLTGQTITVGNTTYSFDVTVNGDTNFESNETFFVNVTNVSGATVSDGQGVGTITNDDCPPPAADIVISQVYGGGGNASAPLQSDFIELYNRGATTVSLAGWSVQYNSAAGAGAWQVTPLSGSIAPGGYYLVQEDTGTGCSGSPCGVPLPTPDATGTIAMAAGAGKVALSSSTTAFTGACPTCPVDLVGYGSTATCFEGGGATGNLSNTSADLRKRRGCTDTNNNNADFTTGSPNPRNTASPLNSCVILSLAIHDIQGSGAASPYVTQDVTTSGIVTARKSNGFFLQEPDASVDANPATSEGVFVFTSSAPTVAVGDAVTINLGSVDEFFNLTEVNTSSSDITVTSSGNPLPTPVVLTTSILDSAGTVAQLERFEGMRLHADSLTSVGPTNEFGEIFTVLTGVARPFREEGVEASFALPAGAPCCVPRFDENPERLMVDSDGQAGATSLTVTSGVTLTNVTGPLDFTFDDYKVLPDTPPSTTSNATATPVRLPTANEFTVGSFNMERFLTATDVTNRLNKVSLAIRNVMRSPDIIGVEEVGDLTLLQTIATKLNDDTVAGGGSDPGYVAYLEEGNDIGGIDVGFLVKSSRVTVNSVTQVGKDTTFIDPNDNSVDLLNDRPPLFLRATLQAPDGAPFPVTVIVNHLRSLIDISDTGTTGNRVRAKRRAQAEFIANEIQAIQATENVVSVGDYNAFQVNDGYVDVMGTIRGDPTPANQVVLASSDLVTPDLTDLIDSLAAAQQYSFVFVGNAQAIDHVLVDPEMLARNSGFGYARNNADFPEAFRSDTLRSERVSDHDMPVAYFTFPPPSADLVVDKQASSGTVTTGSNVNYTITVTNNGPSNAASVVVTDNLPAGLTFVSCNATNGGVCGNVGNNVTVNYTSLASAASSTITIAATVSCLPNGTVISNVASASSAYGDPNAGNNSDSADVTVDNPTITAAGPALMWIGLKNSDDVGTKFDLFAEVFRNGELAWQGYSYDVSGGSSGFNHAVQQSITLGLVATRGFCPGDNVRFRLSVRVAATSSHSSGTARLWFNDNAANSGFSATIGGPPPSTYYLTSGFFLETSPGLGPKQTIDVLVKRAGGNPFKPFGTWSTH